MSRALCIAAAILGFLSWVENIDTVAAQSNSATSGSNISICNDFSTRIYVALASQNQGGFNAAGWWSIEPNANRPIFRSRVLLPSTTLPTPTKSSKAIDQQHRFS